MTDHHEDYNLYPIEFKRLKSCAWNLTSGTARMTPGFMSRTGRVETPCIKGGTHPNRWVERTLLLRQTCRQLGQSTFGVLVDAMTSSFQGRQPDLTWLY